MTSDQIASINRGHISADGKQEIENAHIHAMLQPGQTYAEGVNKMKNHFTDYVMSFLSQNNYEALGEALHCIQDAYSPPHAMQEWNGVNFLPHLFESIYIYQTESEYAINATRAVYESIMSSDGTISGIEQIFDNWLEDYENL